MAIEKLKLFKINADLANLDLVLDRFVDLTCVSPNLASEFIDRVHGLTSFASLNPYLHVYNELLDIEKEYDFDFPVIEVKSDKKAFEETNDFVHEIHEKLQVLTDTRKEGKETLKAYQDALIQIDNIESLDISLDDVFSCEYISARVGRLPLDSVEKLKFYRNKPFIFKTFHEEKEYCWCMYVVTNTYEREIDNIFSSLFFDRIHIPDFVHGTPETAHASLTLKIKETEEEIESLQTQIDHILAAHCSELSRMKSELLRLNKIYEAKRYVVGLGTEFSISGFVAKRDQALLQSKYKDCEAVEVEILPAHSDKRVTIPTKLHNSWFAKPFTLFIEMYGLPSYSSIDPTPILAITFSLLFGMMFGDLGQGLLLSLFGFILYKKSNSGLGAIAMRIGLVSAFFGLLYGSVFGNEEILTPLFTDLLGLDGKLIDIMAPDFTMTLLITTVGIGSILILTSMLINIHISIKKRELATTFFSHNGLAGMVFYIFILSALALQIGAGVNIFNILTIILFIIIPLILIVLKEPLNRLLKGTAMFPESIGGFVIEGFFELFEVVLSYVTNTLSFLRVGGFILAHAGMMMVVFTLMEMSPNMLGHIIIFVIGNLFVMGLEGLIVGIQVLRLEFYEMFSRYYEGDGIPFKTLEQ